MTCYRHRNHFIVIAVFALSLVDFFFLLAKLPPTSYDYVPCFIGGTFYGVWCKLYALFIPPKHILHSSLLRYTNLGDSWRINELVG